MGFSHLCQALNDNTTLETLDLFNNKITADKFEDFNYTLEKNSTLSSLDLDHNKITNDGIKLLCEGLRLNVSMTVLSCEAGDSKTRELIKSYFDRNEINYYQKRMTLFSALYKKWLRNE